MTHSSITHNMNNINANINTNHTNILMITLTVFSNLFRAKWQHNKICFADASRAWVLLQKRYKRFTTTPVYILFNKYLPLQSWTTNQTLFLWICNMKATNLISFTQKISYFSQHCPKKSTIFRKKAQKSTLTTKKKRASRKKAQKSTCAFKKHSLGALHYT